MPDSFTRRGDNDTSEWVNINISWDLFYFYAIFFAIKYYNSFIVCLWCSANWATQSGRFEYSRTDLTA